MKTEVTRIFDILPHYKKNYKPKDDVVVGKENGVWVKHDIEKYIEKAKNISYGLLKLGVKPGDKIATISNNRPEWNFLDMGVSQIGAIHTPIYPTISEDDYRYILKHAEVKYVFVAGKELLSKIEHILPDIPSIKGLFTFKNIATEKHLNDLIELGEKNPAPEKLEKLKANIKEKDFATLIYTSGTTGDPKGVMLSHYNILSNAKAVAHIPPFGEEGKALSYLPLCHVYERMLNYCYQYLGISIYYAENMGKIADNIREIKPDILSTVPRLLEKVYDRIVDKGRKLKGIKRQLFFWSLNLGLKYELNKANGCWYEFKLKIARKLVFSKWQAGLGGNMKVIVSGGAALQERLGRVFTAAGIPCLEGYGLTETSPVITVNDFNKNGWKFGTVGPPVKDVEIKIAEDGEILSRGPNTMLGYFKAPELTKEVIDKDGWFHTGDVGVIEKEGQLRITGRKKEIFKTSLGKYISPQLLENRFKESAFIDNIVVLGENQKFAAALVVPDFEHIQAWCKVKNIKYSTDAEMLKEKVIKQRLQREINTYNKFFGNTEKIMRFELMDHLWSIETGELTANLKLKRGFITKKYNEQVDKLFK
ncbi:MAG: long-chain fatty acid--CoA ligase [Bacteroidales bacterium]|nr:long-chain fatty acid--CoA ligase [Bacteroidales bacterium]